MMRNIIAALLCATLLIPMTASAKKKTVTIKVIETSDVHGCFFPDDFINRKPLKGTLARVMTYVEELRKTHGKNVILVDNGDILQGQPTCYYYNYIKTDLPNVAAEVINYMGYDAETFGNHDVETGHAVVCLYHLFKCLVGDGEERVASEHGLDHVIIFFDRPLREVGVLLYCLIRLFLSVSFGDLIAEA